MTAELPAELAALVAADAAEPAKELDTVTAATLDNLVSEMLDLKSNAEELDALLKSVRTKYDEIRQRRLPDLMQQLGMVSGDGKGSFTHASGAKVHLRLEVYAHYRKENEAEFFEWLRTNGHSGIIRETVNAQTLKAWAKDRVADGEPLPAQLTVTPMTVAVMTAPKQKETE